MITFLNIQTDHEHAFIYVGAVQSVSRSNWHHDVPIAGHISDNGETSHGVAQGNNKNKTCSPLESRLDNGGNRVYTAQCSSLDLAGVSINTRTDR